MDDEEVTGEVVPVEGAPADREGNLRRVFEHGVSPFLFGAVVGAMWQTLVTPSLGPNQLPNPVHGALLAGLMCSPLAHRVLARRPMDEWWEYGVGWAAIAVPLSFIWTIPGPQAFMCGGYLFGVLWMSITSAWSIGPKPPFRLAMWHMIGVGFGAFLGGLLAYGWS
ncbi:MAG: hypothetical protein CMB38_00620 [Euryarchaeota archaeon]|nr:hypothetical protein [Euryarchaeota archaeon]